MNEIKDITDLLNLTAEINKKYEEQRKKTGEDFNIFDLLNVTTKEVQLHSTFITELLNPNGIHHQQTLFLDEFISIIKQASELNQKNIDVAFNSKSTKFVIPEFYIGQKTETEGGRIDILLADNDSHYIIIENKIYAGDQPNQLLRYHNFNKQAPIIYLTLDGKEPTEDSTKKNKNVEDKIICISYKKEIIEWLDNCLKKIKNHPLLSATISQYIYTVKYLTNQTMSEEMKKEIVEIISSSKDNLSSAFVIYSSLYEVKKRLFENFKQQLIEIGENLNFEVTIDSDSFGNSQHDYLRYYLPKSKHKTNIALCFDKEFDKFSIGVTTAELENTSKIFEQLKIQISSQLNPYLNDVDFDNWLYLHYFEYNFDRVETWIAIKDGNKKQEIKEIIEKICFLIQDIEL